MTAKPAFQLSVPEAVWQAVAGAQNPAFADSYLFGATLSHRTLHPRTVTAYLALKERASHCLKAVGIDLAKPEPFQP
jgi:hypothetical protein